MPPSATKQEKSPYKEVVAISPEQNQNLMFESADSSLMISEETQANKRTQSSCKKTKLGQMQKHGAGAQGRHGKHSSVSISIN